MELSKIVDSCEKLLCATSFSFKELPSEVAAIKLDFESFCCFISVLEDSDEIVVADSLCTGNLIESDSLLLFNECCSSELSWAWYMVNNQGYTDALRFEFKNGQIVELVVAASTIKQFRLSEL
ncbi:hypothetical protein CWC22_011090 [Pseudoalteromonas rubra]|uniref:Uncharacterized protein n=1 Tax=Pseudoalteromonas rubra TaxID=43658 RepID=A0A5S3V424_9GAMM|nr:DUF6334 family protein [Pseudoalteromonas rubra]QPB83503.1 hypothetical protein CWC22_011090 [Pseudoalteromonas rubra]